MKKSHRKFATILLLVVGLLVLSSCGGGDAEALEKPIQGFAGFWDIFVWPMAALMYAVGKTAAFGSYGIVILITTLIVRTAAWPIYAKTNDMSLKMQLVGPEQAKLEAKYAGKADPESNQRKQMEMMQLYKKYGIGIGGCLLPLIQFPIFISFYRTLQRIPVTRGAEFPLDFGFLKGSIFGLDLFAGIGESGMQKWGIIGLAALVGITQIVSQILMNRRQKKIKEQSQSSVPAYRQPQQTDQQRQSEIMMKVMMYGMTVMMVVFVYRSTAALGLYWLIGNVFTTLQGYISHKQSGSRLEKLKSKM